MSSVGASARCYVVGGDEAYHFALSGEQNQVANKESVVANIR